MDIDTKAQQNKFAEIVGVSEPAVSGYIKKGFLKEDGTYREWLLAYCERQRTMASNHGGDAQTSLAQARINDLEVTTRLKNLDYQEKLEKLVPVEWAANSLINWARSANQEYQTSIKETVLKIESKYNIHIDNIIIEQHLEKLLKKIREYAEKGVSDLIKTPD